ncbi:coiled-coil domain-containing protein [Candidatus Symbiothrix dinenymphae]|uniref:coiled-coil domain-containing protein n=1 Tax=Candidatus Symbiothrix dinenymphae TaxID=467085 RepID=UPI0006E15465|nr:hypothetical protein [Candidatus Symbiothrix dinenymphae]
MHYNYFSPDPSFDWGSFLGALLGSLIGVIGAIFVFYWGKKSDKNKTHEENKHTLEALSILIAEIIQDISTVKDRIDEYAKKINDAPHEQHEREPLPTFVINRLNKLDLLFVTKLFAEFGLHADDSANFMRALVFCDSLLKEIKTQYKEFNEDMYNKVSQLDNKKDEVAAVKKALNTDQQERMTGYSADMEKVLSDMAEIQKRIEEVLKEKKSCKSICK